MRVPSERTLLLLVGAVQFVNILDFMMVMPLGPDFALALDIPTSRLGLLGGSYTASAAFAGIAGSTFLDRFDRRTALAVAMFGLVLGTIAGGFAWDLKSLLATRIIAGAFGGPATSIALSIVADVVPAERRGKAVGAVMGAFSAASVLGVPAGLELARLGGWQLPFFAVGGLGLVIATLAIFLMPRMTGHLDAKRGLPVRANEGRLRSALELLLRPAVIFSLLGTWTAMMASFLVVPNLSAYLQYNAGYPRESLGILYLVGGVVSFGVMRVVGILVDRFGSARVAAGGTVIFVADLALGFLGPMPLIPVMAVFVGFMIAGSVRGVANNTLSTQVPAPHERARFMSTQSAVQHLAAAAGAVSGSQLLTELPDHRLAGMPAVAGISIALALCLPFLLAAVAHHLKSRAVTAAQPVA